MAQSSSASGFPEPADPERASSNAPWAALVALMLGPLAFSTGAFVFGGLLDPMAGSLGVSVNAVAQLQAAFTVACAVGGPSLALLLRRADRRRLLILVLIFLAAANTASALASSYESLLISRILGGLVGALTVPLASTLAVGLVPPERRGRALAMVSGGTSLAFLFGIPAGSLAGGAFGWPAAFWFAALLSLVVAVLISVLVPGRSGAGTPTSPAEDAPSVVAWPLMGLYAATFLGFAATFASVGLIGPVITAMTGLTGGAIGGMQVLIGVGSIAGLALGATLADGRGTVALVPLFIAIAAAQGLYAVGLWFEVSGWLGVALFALATLPGATALFATFPVIASSIAQRAGAAATMAFALNGATIFLGQGIGVALGGIGFGVAGLAGAALIGVSLGMVGIAVAKRILPSTKV